MRMRSWIASLLLIVPFILMIGGTDSFASSTSVTFLLEDEGRFNQRLSEIHQIAPNADVETIQELFLIKVEGLTTREFEQLNTASDDSDLAGHLPNVYAETVMKAHKSENLVLSDDYGRFNWGYQRVTNHFSTNSYLKNLNKVKVAVIDSGIDTHHPLLEDAIVGGKSFVEGDHSLTDVFGHGTSVGGVIHTLAPGVKLVPYKVIGAIDGESIWVLQAIVEAVKDKVDIINLSIGTYKSKSIVDEQLTIEAYKRAVDFAKKNKIIVVASAGNEGYDLNLLKKEEQRMHLPGGLKNVITVGSTLKSQSIAPYSNYGDDIDITAPTGYFGENYTTKGEINVTEMMLTTFPTSKQNTFIDQAVGLPQGYTLSFGTSLAAPQVSATAALLIANNKNRKLNPQRLKNIIYKHARDLGDKGKDPYYGHGELDIYSTLQTRK